VLKTIQGGELLPSLNLYTLGQMLKAEITWVESETAGHPRENLIDNNPDTTWLPTTGDAQTVTIDLGEAKTIDAVGGWIKSATGSYNIFSDDNDDGAYTAVTSHATVAMSGGYPQFSDITPVSKRYWGFYSHFVGGHVTLWKHSAIWLFKKSTIVKSSQLPRNDITRYYNNVSLAGGGREFIRGVNSNSRTILPRNYLIDDTDYTALKAAFDDSRGRLLPLLVVESGETTRLVRFGSDDLSRGEISHEIYKPSFSLIELPFIPQKETY